MALNLPANLVPSAVKREDGIDLTDSVLAPLYVACTFAMTQVFEIAMLQPWNYDLNYALWAAEGVDITVAFVLGMAIVFVAWVTNGQVTLEDLTDIETIIVLMMIILNILTVLVPPVSSAVAAYWLLGYSIVFLNAAGFYVIAYK
ncbi:hypothetical protein [Halomontanus rarus]|uniref:hypothetical protein n=1 Tax=Halomontanus rarus TaxID=3034020 RepID=UPI0023E8A046|nr:hypothetical protein [Halovivax sp. TS33]